MVFKDVVSKHLGLGVDNGAQTDVEALRLVWLASFANHNAQTESINYVLRTRQYAGIWPIAERTIVPSCPEVSVRLL